MREDEQEICYNIYAESLTWDAGYGSDVIGEQCNKLSGEKSKACFRGVFEGEGLSIDGPVLCDVAKEELKPYCLETYQEMEISSSAQIILFVVIMLLALPFILFYGIVELLQSLVTRSLWA